ncbi:hypothetical protein [Tahibacter soli]|uniref:HAF family extracellular repeat protein n=1 Tax=Tahibacter soli TaxID=2983605 RepID=A0A9X3YM04_9GAMM|nr:hypothetical protein [Tahibacter soli]MDC8014856.1 hypothetical protein [Tahibacter soli]
MKTATGVLYCTLAAALPGATHAAAFTPLGLPGSRLAALSADGCVAAGNVADGGGFRWSVGGAVVRLDAAISVRALSASGRYAAGSSLDAERREVASWWDADGRVHRLGGAAGVDAISVVSQAFGVTDEPRVVGGVGDAASAFVWTPRTGLAVLPAPQAGAARAHGVSDDGAIVYGWSETPTGERRGTVWSRGVPRALADGGGREVREVIAANRTGSVLVGVLGADAAYRWSEATGIVPLPAADAPQWFGASDDGRVLVGSAGRGDARRATVWTQESGAQPLAAWLAARGAALPRDWRAHAVTAVSGDGTRVGGWGTHEGRFDSFVLDTAASPRVCGGTTAAAP